MKRDRVLIFDTSLRDGEQAPGCSMNGDEKLLFARKLQVLGVDIIEAGFPIASAGDAEAVRRIATEVQGPIIAALARCVEKDIAVAWEAVSRSMRPRIHTFLATSDIHLAFKLKIGRDEALHQAAKMVAYARSLCTDVEFSPEDATRSDVGFLCEVLQAAVEAGATTLNIPDTVGYTTPGEYGELIRTIRQRVKGIENVTISVHCHNDLGLGGGQLAGRRRGRRAPGGVHRQRHRRARRQCLAGRDSRWRCMCAPTATASKPASTMPEIYSASQLLSELIGFEVQPNKAIVGRNAFAHEAGIHQHGVLSNPLCYEIMTPETVGIPAERIVLGKHSGRHALVYKYRELGHELSGDEINRIYQEFTRLADRKKNIYEQDLLAMLYAHRGGMREPKRPAGDAPGMKLRIVVLPGDGIGPEVTKQAVAVLQTVSDVCGYDFRFESHRIGGAAIEQDGTPLPEKTLAACLEADAVLLGAVGARKFDDLTGEKRPEAGLLALRQALGGFANLRPVKAYEAIADCSPLREDVTRGADILIVRELARRPVFRRSLARSSDDGLSAYNTMRYHVDEIERVAHIAFQEARRRKHLVTSVDKANVLETSQLWRRTVTEVAQAISRRAAGARLRRFLRHAAGHDAGALRRGADRESVRRHSVGRSRGDQRIARHAGVGQRRRQGRALRAGTWLGARHRRQEAWRIRSARSSRRPCCCATPPGSTMSPTRSCRRSIARSLAGW